jgi:iron(II)-dependent oxidoreductase
MCWACEDLAQQELLEQFDAEFSPIGWHLGHVAWQEEMWVLRGHYRMPALYPAFDEVFDSFRPDKRRRAKTLPSKGGLFEYRSEVRARVLDRLEDLVEAPCRRLMEGPGLVRFVANHESQHIETVLAMRLAGALSFKTPNPAAQCSCKEPSPTLQSADDFVALTGGSFAMGSDVDPERWDNESPCYRVDVLPFSVQRRPVSNRAWLEFLQQGGYRTRSLWSEEGWAFLARSGVRAPLYWLADGHGCFRERTLAGMQPLDLGQCVAHISWHEAQAFARFAGARMLTEAEWEWLACQRPPQSAKGSAEAALDYCLSLAHLSPVHSGWHPTSGVEGLRGGVWEWTSEVFLPYPGFQAQAYRGYSEPWFDGSHRVARGGSYATEPEIARDTFRNWYLPEMRRAFLGLRLAKDDC